MEENPDTRREGQFRELIHTLAAALRVEHPHVVIDGPWRLVDDLLVKDVAAEEGNFALRVEGPVQRDPAGFSKVSAFLCFLSVILSLEAWLGQWYLWV